MLTKIVLFLRRRRTATAGLVVVATLNLSACVPALLTVQPEADIVVKDVDGRSIEGATVHLASVVYPHGPREVVTRTSDSDGAVRIPRRREWVLQILIVDGMISFGFGLCVDKPGYRPFIAEMPDFSRQLVIALEPEAASLRCKWPEESARAPAIIVPAT